ncbi:hypothetical protein HY988_00650 [Candidatus Micrarchaeota archaeon]|nr:hypothetical protein [Candidatus Micrarchaeota archaeon]
MGNVMISLEDDDEKELRKYAQQISGGKKGSLSEFVWQAIAHYISETKKEQERNAAFERILERAKHAKKLGILNKEGKVYSSREEIYAERMEKIRRH